MLRKSNNGKQSRYFETAALMDEALLSLLEDRDLEFVTVKEICAKAGVNRSTFYLHYDAIDDLLQETVEAMNRHFLEEMASDRVSAVAVISDISDAPPERLLFVTEEYLMPYLRYVEKHKRLFRTALLRSSALQLDRSYRGLYRHVISPVLDRFGVPENDRGYIVAFYMKGLMAILEEWLRRECADSVERICALMQNLVAR